ncbi:MAG: sugar transferase [Chloroflexi bacterium]|nr:sugar transferase [Chloroflexota bacterium]
MSEVKGKIIREDLSFEVKPAAGAHRRQMPLPVAERRMLLTALDLMAVNGALLLALAARPRYDLGLLLVAQYPHWFLLLSAIWIFLAHAFDAYDLRIAGQISTTLPAAVKAGIATSLVYLVIPFLTPVLPNSRLEIALYPLLTLALLIVGRLLYAQVLAQPFFDRRVLVIGTGPAAQSITQAIREFGDGTYRIEGYIENLGTEPGWDQVQRPAGAGVSAAVADTSAVVADGNSRKLADDAWPDNPGILGDGTVLPELVEKYRVTTLILATTGEVHGQLLQNLMDCLERGVEILPMAFLYEQLTGRVQVENVGGHWSVAMPIYHLGTGALWPVVKRAMDILLSALGLILLGVALPFIGLAISLNSRGPIFYSQERVGKGGRIFLAWKFRSMIVDAEKETGAVWAQKNDPRITQAGILMRKTRLDELPQLWNILKGEMSLVGPRPERPEFVAQLAQQIPFYRVRLAEKPGLTGWAQVKYPYSDSVESALVKLQYDLYYIKHQNIFLDLLILLKTVQVMLGFKGR